MSTEFEGAQWILISSAVRNREFSIQQLKLEVPGGWLVRSEALTAAGGCSTSVCFIPDPDGDWGRST